MLFDFENIYFHGFGLSSEVNHFLGNEFYFSPYCFNDLIYTFSSHSGKFDSYSYDVKLGTWNK